MKYPLIFGNVFVCMSTNIHFADVGVFSDIVYFQRGWYIAQNLHDISVIPNLLILLIFYDSCSDYF